MHLSLDSYFIEDLTYHMLENGEYNFLTYDPQIYFKETEDFIFKNIVFININFYMEVKSLDYITILYKENIDAKNNKLNKQLNSSTLTLNGSSYTIKQDYRIIKSNKLIELYFDLKPGEILRYVTWIPNMELYPFKIKILEILFSTSDIYSNGQIRKIESNYIYNEDNDSYFFLDFQPKFFISPKDKLKIQSDCTLKFVFEISKIKKKEFSSIIKKEKNFFRRNFRNFKNWWYK
jgi:hypothetical protein